MTRTALAVLALTVAGCASAQSAVPVEGNMMVYEYCDTGLKSVHYLNTEDGDEVWETDGGRGLSFRHVGDVRYVDVSADQCSIRFFPPRRP